MTTPCNQIANTFQTYISPNKNRLNPMIQPVLNNYSIPNASKVSSKTLLTTTCCCLRCITPCASSYSIISDCCDFFFINLQIISYICHVSQLSLTVIYHLGNFTIYCAALVSICPMSFSFIVIPHQVIKSIPTHASL